MSWHHASGEPPRVALMEWTGDRRNRRQEPTARMLFTRGQQSSMPPPNHSQRKTLVERAVYAANSTSNAATFTHCAPQPDPSHTPWRSATACVVGSRYATALSARGSRATGKNSPDKAIIG